MDAFSVPREIVHGSKSSSSSSAPRNIALVWLIMLQHMYPSIEKISALKCYEFRNLLVIFNTESRVVFFVNIF